MKPVLRLACLILTVLLAIACSTQSTPYPPAVGPVPRPPVTADPASEPKKESVPAQSEATPGTEPSPEPTEAPTPEPTEAPTPEPTPEPKEGEIALHFPDYDTGVDADYSYQSDDLRIAVTVHQEIIKDHLNRDIRETYYVADIWIRNLNSFRIAFSGGEYGSAAEDPTALVQRENAILAVNGNYSQGLTLQGGVLRHNWRQNKGWNSCAIAVLYKDGSFKTFCLGKERFNLEQELKNGAWHAWQFGPIVIRNYEEGPDATKYGNMGFKARNILGYYEPGHYVIMTCDNSSKNAQGMNEYQMVAVMKSLGVKEAFNLDGGTSAVLVFMGEIINHPTMRSDHGNAAVGRPIVDMLVFGEYDENGNSPDLPTLTPAKFKDKD